MYLLPNCRGQSGEHNITYMWQAKGKICEGIQGQFEENTVWAYLKSSIKIKRNKNVLFFFKDPV